MRVKYSVDTANLKGEVLLKYSIFSDNSYFQGFSSQHDLKYH